MAASTLPDADSVTASSVDHSSRNSGQSNSSSPKSSSRRSGGRTVSSPWNQIVRGELDTAAAVSSSVSSTTVVEPVTFTSSSSATSEEPVGECYDGGNGSSANAGKKPVWNKLANGTEVGPVMGAVSWPALSESAKGTPKSSSDSIKSLGDGSAGAQGIGTSSSSSNNEGNNDVSPNPDSTLTHPITSRQKSMRRNGSNSSYNSALSQQSAHSSPVIDPAPNSSSRDQTQRTAFISSQSHNDHGHQQPRSSFRSRGGASHPRGDNSHHHNYSSRRDHDRGNQDWNSNRNFNAQPHRVVHRFIRPPPPPPPNTTGFISSPTMRPIGGPLPFPDFVPPVVYIGPPPPPPPPPPEALRGVPFVAPIPPNAMFFHGPDPHLYAMIVSQIEYYFSGENLVKDTFLRQKMDEDGWVPVRLIATFSKVKRLTENIQTILDALQSSTLVEVKGDKVRRRNDYDRWIIRPGQVPNIAAPLSPVSSNQDMLAAGVQGIALENINHRDSEGGQGGVHVEALHSSSPTGNLSMQAQPCGDDRPGQVNTKAGPDCSSAERS
ncbi:la-related protein 1C-like [Cucurbita pepo subsp. pepo]|uniref:la-related protein 1C-like n=1 Tax=Cucurbita pepo subsp. pepo TaxID=3664 RepID=UPI000C9D43CF|nr:la-related protein 1C-like [Cucurbita pepo subsp. pepo]